MRRGARYPKQTATSSEPIAAPAIRDFSNPIYVNQPRQGLLPPHGSSTFAVQSAAGALPRTRTARPIQFTPSPTELVAPPQLATRTSRADTPSIIGKLGAWALVTFGWALFASWWIIVLQRESVRSFGVALGLLAATLGAVAVAMGLWTRHNMRLARRGKRGTSSAYIPMEWERDTLGRRLELPAPDVVRTAAEVCLELRDGAKAYVVPDKKAL
jgi:hypothetical protein